MYIKELIINGFKKFNFFRIEFNEHINVLIGENEAGKSTILEAIDIVLNQRIFNSKSNFEKYLNINDINKYKANPSIEYLPFIHIELIFSENNDLDNAYFNGLHSSYSSILKNGINFTYKFDESFRELYETSILNTENEIFIPTDYYVAEWITFSGRKYINKKSPLKNVLIDNAIRKNNLFDSYSKTIYTTNFNQTQRQNLSHKFKNKLQKFINENNDELIIKEYTLGIDENKTILDNIIDLKSDGVSLQNKGKGRENLIKTEIALEINSDLIMLEEPENHLSYINTRKLISEIQTQCEKAQIIITTHNPLIVSRLNLKNTIWINNDLCHSLNGIDKTTADYFMKTDNMQLLNFILAQKVILVEGNSEYITLPFILKNSLNIDIEEQSIEILSAGGITYKHYIEIAKIVGNKLLIITDNDNNQETIDEIDETNLNLIKSNHQISIKCSKLPEEFTFEVCLFNRNKGLFGTTANLKPKTVAEYRKNPVNKNLAYMLKNKTETALRITTEDTFKAIYPPDYIKEGIEWLLQQ